MYKLQWKISKQVLEKSNCNNWFLGPELYKTQLFMGPYLFKLLTNPGASYELFWVNNSANYEVFSRQKLCKLGTIGVTLTQQDMSYVRGHNSASYECLGNNFARWEVFLLVGIYSKKTQNIHVWPYITLTLSAKSYQEWLWERPAKPCTAI